MYWITAIIRPFKLSEVYERLLDEGISGMTVTEVKGFGNQRADSEIYRGHVYTSRFVPKIKIEIAVDKADLTRVVESIMQVSRTGNPGDGKVFVSELNQAYRIRTEETNTQAL